MPLHKKETKKIKNFLKQDDVKKVIEDYDEQLGHFFKFYCNSEHHAIGMDLELDQRSLDFWEFVRFCYQCNIVPTLISVEDCNTTYHRIMRERDAEHPDSKHQVLEWEYFLRALVRIACLG